MKRMNSVKCDSTVMFRFIISLVLIFRGVVVITSAQSCSQSSHNNLRLCHDKVEIKYPFWYDDDDKNSYVFDYHCGYPGFGIKCETHAMGLGTTISTGTNVTVTSGTAGTNVTFTSSTDYSSRYCEGSGISRTKCVQQGTPITDGSITVMNISNQLYRASGIHYENRVLTLKEMDMDGEECPHPRQNLSLQEFGSSLSYRDLNWCIFYNCSSPPSNKDVDQFHLSCLDNSGRRSYAFPNESLIPKGFNWYGKCKETLVAPSSNNGLNYNYTLAAKQGFFLKWSTPIADCKNCESSGGRCSYNREGGFRKCSCGSDFSKEFDKFCPRRGPSVGVSPRPSQSNQSVGLAPSNQPPNHRERGLSTGIKVLIGVCTGVGVLLLLVLLVKRRILFSIYMVFTSHWRNIIKGPTNVEMFLKSCGHLTVPRYKYSDIKKMTNSFQETVGQGGYGSVFKGKLKHDGRLVAVKLLNESKGNGEEFINEVVTIGRTNHVNVVSLLGFCTEGTKRALVYEFMPNGSLERFIYNEKASSTPLGWEKLYQIALGIARGLEYLHRGCNTRILHFDIKPHNILLDQEFIPKISDFGLAKLCPTRESVVSMLAARGTVGYIAPEVICRNFGGVSHKSDVYSYGMMVFEIIGRRKNIDATVENMSEIYFPQWIYNHFIEQEINVDRSREIFEDKTTKKMIIVALWCIQTQPVDRPSISKVVEMLEGNIEDLQMPPNPFQDHSSRSSP